MPKLIGAYLNTMGYIAPHKAAQQGFYLFCTPVKPPVLPYHREFLDRAAQFQFESNGTGLKGYRWGNGDKKLLFLHGWQSHTFRWKKYIESFDPEAYTLFAFDAPAHGLSSGKYINIPMYSDAIHSFFREAGPVDSVISHSMGSFSVLHALHHHDLPIRKLVLMGSPGEARDFIAFYRAFTGLNDRSMGLILDYFVEKLDRTPDYFSAPAFAASVKVPGLIIHDEHDDEAPIAHARRIHAAWPKSRLVTTQGIGHNLKSPQVVEMVKEFVEGGD